MSTDGYGHALRHSGRNREWPGPFLGFGGQQFVCDFSLDDQGSVSWRGKICLSSTAPRKALEPKQHPIQWVLEALSPGEERPGREADHASPSNAEVKNGDAIHLLPDTSS